MFIISMFNNMENFKEMRISHVKSNDDDFDRTKR